MSISLNISRKSIQLNQAMFWFPTDMVQAVCYIFSIKVKEKFVTENNILQVHCKGYNYALTEYYIQLGSMQVDCNLKLEPVCLKCYMYLL